MEFLTETVKFNDILVYIIGVYESHCCESKGKIYPIGFELKFQRFGQDRIELSSFSQIGSDCFFPNIFNYRSHFLPFGFFRLYSSDVSVIKTSKKV